MQKDDYFKFPWLTPKRANYLLLNGKWKFHYTADRHRARRVGRPCRHRRNNRRRHLMVIAFYFGTQHERQGKE